MPDREILFPLADKHNALNKTSELTGKCRDKKQIQGEKRSTSFIVF